MDEMINVGLNANGQWYDIYDYVSLPQSNQK